MVNLVSYPNAIKQLRHAISLALASICHHVIPEVLLHSSKA